jgi:hypothetical protein
MTLSAEDAKRADALDVLFRRLHPRGSLPCEQRLLEVVHSRCTTL